MSESWQTQGSGRGAVGNAAPAVHLIVGQPKAKDAPFVPKSQRTASVVPQASIQQSKPTKKK